MRTILVLAAALVGIVHSSPVVAQNLFYEFESAGDAVNGRVISPDVYWGSAGCIDQSTQPPTVLHDLQYRRTPSGAIRLPVEGERYLVQVERLVDTSSGHSGVRISKVGCGEAEVLFELPPGPGNGYSGGDTFASLSRPIVLSSSEGISLFDLESGSAPTLLIGGQSFHDEALRQIDRLPFGNNNGREVEQVVFAGVMATALDDGQWLGVVSTGIQFAGLSSVVGQEWLVLFRSDGSFDVIGAPDEGEWGDVRPYPAWGVVSVGSSFFPLEPAPVDVLRQRGFAPDYALNVLLRQTQPYLDNQGSLVVETSYVRKVLETADLDGDGATALQEQQLGTHDGNPDFDDDGIQDGTEISIGTDPLVADPPEPGGLKAIGFTNLLQEWAPISPVRVDAENERIRTGPFNAFAYPFTPQLSFLCQFTDGAARTGWFGGCYNRETGTETSVDLPSGSLHFLDDELAFNRDQVVNWKTGEALHTDLNIGQFIGLSVTGEAITRLVATDHGALTYYEPQTWTGRDVRLGDGIEPYAVAGMRFLGADEESQTDYFVLTESVPGALSVRDWIYGLKDGELVRLIEHSWLVREAGLEYDPTGYIGAISRIDRGFVVQLYLDSQTAAYVTLDSKFRPTNVTTGLPPVTLGQRWDLGQLAGESYRHLVGIAVNGSPDASCISLDGVIACDAEPGKIARLLGEAEESVVHQIIGFDSSGLGPDDAVLGRYGLWRYTPEGAIVPWLDERAMVELGLTPEVDFTPGTNIASIAIRRDRRAICFVRENKAFRLDLDESGEFDSLEVVRDAGVHACGWSFDGKLALSDQSGGMEIDGEPFDVEVRGNIRTLFSVPGDRWVILTDQWESQCVGPSGPMGLRREVNGIAVFDDSLVYLVSSEGRPTVLHLDRFCSEEATSDGGDLYPPFLQGGLWTTLYFVANRSVTPTQSVNSGQSFIAPISTDHILLLGLEMSGGAYNGTTPPVPFRLRPGYRVSGKEAEAIGTPRFNVGTFSRAAERVFTAMASAPNTSLRSTPTYYVEGTLPPTGGEEPPDGPSAPEEHDDGSTGCGCASGAAKPDFAWLLVALFWWIRRRTD